MQQQPSDEILRRGRDQFDRLYLDGETAPRVMAISIHPYLTGVPHRIKYLEMLYDYILGHDGVVMWTGARDPRLVRPRTPSVTRRKLSRLHESNAPGAGRRGAAPVLRQYWAR